MIKTVKIKKKLRLDELIKYVIDKGLNSFQFTSDNNVDVYFSSNGYFLIAGDGSGDEGSRSFELADTFTVEVEEEITEDMEFDHMVYIPSNGTSTGRTVIKMRLEQLIDSAHPIKVYALIDKSLELIWEADEDVNQVPAANSDVPVL